MEIFCKQNIFPLFSFFSVISMCLTITPVLFSKTDQIQAVQIGAEVLLNNSDDIEYLKNKQVGLLVNSSSWVKQRHLIDTLIDLNISVTTLFAPEHGLRGNYEAGEDVKNNVDFKTGLPIISLYGKTKKPTQEMLKNIDIILFDIQDVGARFYTYYSTLGLVLEAATESNIEVWILDRPNPAGGNYIEGWVTKETTSSFLSPYPMPITHGMTMGELAHMMIGENWITLPTQANGKPKKTKLRVIPMKGWTREMRWPETQLTWHPPSPNLPDFTHAFLYLGTCLFEGTTISEGRGTEHPFLWIGDPNFQWDNGIMNTLQEHFGFNLTYITFIPKSIKGKSSNPKHKNKRSHGVAIQMDPNPDWNKLDPVRFGISLVKMFIENTPGSHYTPFIYKLAGTNNLSNTDWENEIEIFKSIRKPYLIYY